MMFSTFATYFVEDLFFMCLDSGIVNSFHGLFNQVKVKKVKYWQQ